MRTPAVMLVLLTLCGCERGMHDMYDQPRYGADAPSPLFSDGSAARSPPPGTQAYSAGAPAQTTSGRWRDRASGARPPITLALLQRGHERYDVYCAPCHGLAGDGDGIVAQRGFPAPPSYHQDRLRDAPDAYFYGVISDGYGVMYPYGDRLPPADRWAVVAYVRALQTSRRVQAERLDARDRASLDHGGARP